MVLRLIADKWPLDYVVFYSNGADFQATLDVRDKLERLCVAKGVQFVNLYPSRDFFYDMLQRPVYSEEKGQHNGWGWCGGVCRWGTKEKTLAIDKWKSTLGAHVVEYIGIAADEPERIKDKVYPLVQWGMTERDCLDYCYERGYTWAEFEPETNRYIRLYDIFDRVSCWCCCNKNLPELRNMYRFLPSYWGQLIELQKQLDRPMKAYKNQKYGAYGDVRRLGEVFAEQERAVQ